MSCHKNEINFLKIPPLPYFLPDCNRKHSNCFRPYCRCGQISRCK